jgi:uncharacterized protein (DUF1330 family)
MSAFMIVYMNIIGDEWIADYFSHVPRLLTEYEGRQIAGSRDISSMEGTLPAPDRIAVFEFPSMKHLSGFMMDDRYHPFKTARERGARSEIFVFENESVDGELC